MVYGRKNNEVLLKFHHGPTNQLLVFFTNLSFMEFQAR